MENIRNLSNKKVVITSILIFILILAIAFTYAIWTSNFTQTGENVSNYDCFDITFSENNGSGFTLSNQIPITDAQGLQNSYYSVTIKNTCNIGASYNVLLNKMNSSTLADSHVKIAVNSNVSLLSNLPSVKTSLSSASSARNIYSGVLSARGTATIKIQSWMDENTSVAEGTNKSFTYKITIDAISGGNELAKLIKKNVITSEPNFSANHTDKGLYVQKGDSTKSIDGKPTYYFRGNVDNNYLKFDDGTIWRIVRINEDGTIRIIKASNIGTSVFGSNALYSGSTIETYLNNWINTTDYDVGITESTFCNDVSGNAYDRLKGGSSVNPTFACSSELLKLKVGLITADEAVYAGVIADSSSPSYLSGLVKGWVYTMTNSFDGRDSVNMMFVGLGYQHGNTANAEVYPVINLKADIIAFGGDGTSSNPYLISFE